MRKLRTYDELVKIQRWLLKRGSVRTRLRNAKSIEDFLALPNVMSEKNLEESKNYEWSLLGAGVRVPNAGDIYITIRRVPVTIEIGFDSKTSTIIDSILPEGARLIIGKDHPKSFVVTAYPQNPETLETHLIPTEILQDKNYMGYYGFSIKIRELKDGLRFIRRSSEEAGRKHP